MSVLEREIERALVGMIRGHGGLCLKWVCPGFAGVPDRIILLPGGRVIFVETKRPKGGKVSALQNWWRKKLRELGFGYWMVYSRTGIEMLERHIREGGKNEV